jgi:hypothetical protein
MRKELLLILGSLAVCSAVMVVAQTLPSTFPPRNLPKTGAAVSRMQLAKRTFRINGAEYQCTLTPGKEGESGSEWGPASPLPFTLAKAEQIGRSALRQFVADDSPWQVTEVSVSRFTHSTDWYYAVTLKPEMEAVGLRPQSFTVLVDFSEKPGRISRIADPQTQ